MIRYFLLLIGVLVTNAGFSQTYHSYHISFPEAHHHLAEVAIEFPNLENKVLEVQMSRTSPGRYAIHDFAKNVFNVKAFDENGKALVVTRVNPQQWEVSGHSSFVKFTYQLFANRADGTYSQIDASHAHLNMPATFMYAKDYEYRPVRVNFDLSYDKNWKVATQLENRSDGLYYAPNLAYLMDSPTEISDFSLREYEENSNGKTYKIRLALHHQADSKELIDKYFDRIKAIVKQEKMVFGELPDFDFGTYTFLACYRSNASGDGMEHRNSTILTDGYGLADGGFDDHIGTVSHEFFHAWNVERIRPAALEPFSFEDANMSGELWFAEGFTSYYTRLILCRAGIITPKQYVEGLSRALNYVWNSPARQFFNPIEMSYQAPFVDAATSVDPTNRENTFISYYSYGSVLGLALDLSLRKENDGKNLDAFMKQVWQKYGKNEVPYTVKDLEHELSTYAGQDFSRTFFDTFIYQTEVPDYPELFAAVGIKYELKNPGRVYLGARIEAKKGGLLIARNPSIGSPLYEAGLTANDQIMSFDGELINNSDKLAKLLESWKPGEETTIKYTRFGEPKSAVLKWKQDPEKKTVLIEENGERLSKNIRKTRDMWLQGR